jgi:NAD(P)H-dependent FMN reductase
MTTIVGFSGSTRAGSLNAALLAAAADLMPEGASLSIASIADIPRYNGDLEKAEGIPAPVAALKDQIAGAAGLLIATPEYNNSIPGVVKNAIDWLSRPPGDIGRVFGGRPVALMGATPGGGGTRLSQIAWLPVLRTLGAPLYTGQLYAARAHTCFDDDRRLTDDDLRERLGKFVSGFVGWIGDAA